MPITQAVAGEAWIRRANYAQKSRGDNSKHSPYQILQKKLVFRWSLAQLRLTNSYQILINIKDEKELERFFLTQDTLPANTEHL